jgi:hypothetical protein
MPSRAYREEIVVTVRGTSRTTTRWRRRRRRGRGRGRAKRRTFTRRSRGAAEEERAPPTRGAYTLAGRRIVF